MTALPDTILIQHRNRDASPHSPGASRRPGTRVPTAVTRGSLEAGMLMCLGLLAKEPERFEAAAIAWHGRWCAQLHGIGFAESQAVLSALEALAGPDSATAAYDLFVMCQSHGLDEVAAVFDAWLQRRSGSVATLQVQPVSEHPAAASGILGPLIQIAGLAA